MPKIILMLMFASSLFAGYSGEIYTYGYFEFVRDNLLALSGVVAQNNDILFKIVFMLSIFIFAVKNLGNPQKFSMLGLEFSKYLVMIVLVQQMFLKAPDDDKHAYAIVDKITSETVVVRQIPKGIGEILSLFSRAEDAVMVKMETFFSTPNSISYRNAGLGFSFSAPMEIFQQTILDSNLKKTFNNYYENCKMLGDFGNGDQDIATILNSKSLETSLSTDNTLLTVVYTSAQPNGYTTECKTAWGVIQAGLNSGATAQLNVLAQARGMTAATYGSKAELASNTVLGSSLSAQEQLKEAMLRNASLEAIQNTAAYLGLTQDQLAKNKSIAEMSMTNEAILSNLEAQGLIPIMKAICLSFVIALSWILAILTIITLNMSYIRFLVALNVWLMLWSPLYTVLNYAMDIMVTNALSGYTSGPDLSNQLPIYTILGAKLAMLSKLVWAIPMLAFAVAKGSDHAMVSFIGGAGAGIAAGATQAGRSEMQAAQSGKAEYTDFKGQFTDRMDGSGRTRIGTTTNSDGSTIDYSMRQTSAGAVGDLVNKATGNSVNASDNGNVSVGAARLQSQILASLQNQTGLAKENSYAASQAIVEGGQKVISDALKVSKGTMSKEDFNESYGTTDTQTNAISVAASKAMSNVQKTLESGNFSISADQANQIATRFGYGADAGGGGSGSRDKSAQSEKSGASFLSSMAAKIGLNVGMSEDGSFVLSSKNGQTYSLNKNDELSKQFSKTYNSTLSDSVSKDEKLGMTIGSATSKSEGVDQSVVESRNEQYQESFQKMRSLKESYSRAESLTSSQGVQNLDAAMLNYLRKNESSKDFFNSDGSFKDAQSMQAASMMALKKLDSWTQDLNGAQKFNDFMRDYGDSKIDTSKINDNNFKDIKGDVDQKIEDGKNTGTNLTEQQIREQAEDIEKTAKQNINNGAGAIEAKGQEVGEISKEDRDSIATAKDFVKTLNDGNFDTNYNAYNALMSQTYGGNEKGVLDSNLAQGAKAYSEIENATKALVGGAAALGIAYAQYKAGDLLMDKIANARSVSEVEDIVQKSQDLEKGIRNGKPVEGLMEEFGMKEAFVNSGGAFNRDGSIDKTTTQINQGAADYAKQKVEANMGKNAENVARQSLVSAIDERIDDAKTPEEKQKLQDFKERVESGRNISVFEMANNGFGAGAKTNAPIDVGSTVKALDRNNYGTVTSMNDDGTANVKFTSKDGNVAEKTMKLDQIEGVKSVPKAGNFDFKAAGQNILGSTITEDLNPNTTTDLKHGGIDKPSSFKQELKETALEITIGAAMVALGSTSAQAEEVVKTASDTLSALDPTSYIAGQDFGDGTLRGAAVERVSSGEKFEVSGFVEKSGALGQYQNSYNDYVAKNKDFDPQTQYIEGQLVDGKMNFSVVEKSDDRIERELDLKQSSQFAQAYMTPVSQTPSIGGGNSLVLQKSNLGEPKNGGLIYQAKDK